MEMSHTTAKDIKELERSMSEAEKKINELANTTAKKQKATTAKKRVESDAELLKKFVNKNGLAIEKSRGKIYLLAEAWQFVAKLKGLIPSFESASEFDTTVNSKGESIRYLKVTTTCILRRESDLQEVSRATIVATSLESFLSDKPAYAIWGMSQTRAMSRAIRNIYGYIARDAGYQATPFEEVQ